MPGWQQQRYLRGALDEHRPRADRTPVCPAARQEIIDLTDPPPTSWTDADLAIGLSRTYRPGGHSAWKRPLSVAQPSLTVLAIREVDGDLTAKLALYELLHDRGGPSRVRLHHIAQALPRDAGSSLMPAPDRRA